MINPTSFEQYMLELVNLARADPGKAAEQYGFNLGNIPDAALEPLAMNEDLLEAARGHSDWMEQTDTFSHTGAGGSSPTERAEAAGWAGNGVGENISGWFSFGQSDINQQEVVEERHGSLLRSPGHLSNIMNPAWSEAGIGAATGDWQDGGRNYDSAFLYSQSFSDRGLSFLTGVAFDDGDGDNFYDVGEGLGGIEIKITNADGEIVETSSWDAGGYQIALDDGDYTVQFSGEGINGVVEKTVTIAGGNVKLDINSDLEVPVVADQDPDPTPPTDETPDVDEPTDETPDVDQPTDETPDVDEPTDETPDVDEPTDETPDVDEPTDETPDVDEPTDETPDVDEPTDETPDEEQPDVVQGPSVVSGTAGDDIFMDMAGDQIILAGDGNDVFDSENSFDDYQFDILPNEGVLLRGVDSTKLLFGVETLEFSNLTIQFKPGEADVPAPGDDGGDTDPDQTADGADVDTTDGDMGRPDDFRWGCNADDMMVA